MTRTTTKNPKSEIRNPKPLAESRFGETKYAIRKGSAMILAVVLTSLLAIIGVIFLLSSRVDSVATSAIADNVDLGLAVDSVITQITEDLALDVPGDPCNPQEYYDYPDPCGNTDQWLACLEPSFVSAGNYHWRRVSDIYGTLLGYATDVKADVVLEYQPTVGPGQLADADGDGVIDAIWVPVLGKTSSKGKTVYVAVRIVDNGGMLNVNTGYKFDPCDFTRVDGSSQTQINLMALSQRGFNPSAQDWLDNYRCGTGPNDIFSYANNVVWQYGQPAGPYTPFDISDELKLRNRYILLNYNNPVKTRIGNLWTNTFKIGPEVPRYTPYNNINDPNDWFWIVYNSYPISCPDPCTYDYRHIATIQNLDRVIRPNGEKMLNINSEAVANSRDAIYTAIRAGLDPNLPNSDVCQITANLIDYIDADDDVTETSQINVITGMMDYYYGFETPCIYISEIAQNWVHYVASDVNAFSYAIELHKPYWEDRFPSTNPSDDWQLWIPSSYLPPRKINWSGSNRFHVLENIDMAAPIEVNFTDVNGPNDINEPNNPRTTQQFPFLAFEGGEEILLQRRVHSTDPNIQYITVDQVWVPEPNASVGWLKLIDVNDPNLDKIRLLAHSYQRDIGQGINPHKCIRGRPIAAKLGLWSGDFGDYPLPTLGGPNPWIAPEPYNDSNYIIQAHPANRPFTNIGDIGKIFRTNAYLTTRADSDFTVKLNLEIPAFQRLFDYLTVIDPFPHTGDPNQTRIKGRININTAPWYVIAQLPWVSQRIGWTNYALARSIVANRDLVGPFQSIGQLNRVVTGDPCSSISFFASNGIDDGYPDLTPNDLAIDDFEERDVIFARISDLITVRSDVFTAYILVRIGETGPQKRVIAILDRSGVTPAGGKVKIVAIQQVPDAR